MDTFVIQKYSNIIQCLQKAIFPKASHYELIPLCAISYIIKFCKAMICHYTYVFTNASRHINTYMHYQNFPISYFVQNLTIIS